MVFLEEAVCFRAPWFENRKRDGNSSSPFPGFRSENLLMKPSLIIVVGHRRDRSMTHLPHLELSWVLVRQLGGIHQGKFSDH